jgi:hypothetical protein
MSPAIELIIDRNERTLAACEDMLAALAYYGSGGDMQTQLDSFRDALSRAQNNITEAGESGYIEKINSLYSQVFMGNGDVLGTIKEIKKLSDVNRQAMIDADHKAKQIGNAGAWGIVFMGTLIFLVSMISLRYFKKNIADLNSEISCVLREFNGGDRYRRCSGEVSEDGAALFSEVNKVLDRVSADV